MPRQLFSRLSLIIALTPAGASAGEPAVIARGAIQPQLAIDRDGGVYAVFIQKGNICVVTSTDKGVSFGAPVVAIDVKGRANGGAQRGPRIGVDAKKRITVTAPVTFDDAEYAKKYPTAELYVVTSSDGGKTWTAPVRVNEAPKKAPEALHWLAVAPSGEAFVTWLDLRGRLEPGQDLYSARVVDGKVSKNEKIAAQVCECCAPGLAVAGTGGDARPVFAWREGGDKVTSRNILIHGARAGESPDHRERLNGADTRITTCPMSAPAVAVSADGTRWIAAWMDERDEKAKRRVYYRSSESSRAPGDAPVDASSAARQDHPATVFDGAGVAWIAWEEGERAEKRIRFRSVTNGSRPADAGSAAFGKGSFPSLAAGGGIVALVYEAGADDEKSVVFRRLE
jgi:hypothetical protein